MKLTVKANTIPYWNSTRRAIVFCFFVLVTVFFSFFNLFTKIFIRCPSLSIHFPNTVKRNDPFTHLPKPLFIHKHTYIELYICISLLNICIQTVICILRRSLRKFSKQAFHYYSKHFFLYCLSLNNILYFFKLSQSLKYVIAFF